MSRLPDGSFTFSGLTTSIFYGHSRDGSSCHTQMRREKKRGWKLSGGKLKSKVGAAPECLHPNFKFLFSNIGVP